MPGWFASKLTLTRKLVGLIVGLFIILIWLLAWFSATVLESQLETLLADQQFGSVQLVASDLDGKLRDRVDGLVRAAGRLPRDLSSSKELQHFLSEQSIQPHYFSAGIAVLNLDGVTIADYPVAPGRQGTNFGDREYFRQVVARHAPYIDKPIIGRALNRPVLTIGVPVFDGAGKLRAVMTGITDLTAPNFLGGIADPTKTGKGEFFVISPRDNLIVASTDGERAMTAAPAQGANLFYDRVLAGFQGSGVARSSLGANKLFSAARIPAADWVLLAALPTEVAYAPAATMRRWLFFGAAALTAAAIFLVNWMARRVLAPLRHASRAMKRMTEGGAALSPLPVRRHDEVGELLTSFNHLVAERQSYEEALKEEEERLRRAVGQLEQSNSELARLAQVASHDLQEPCRAVCSFAQLLVRDYANRLDETGREYVNYLVHGSYRMRDLAQGLSEYLAIGGAPAAMVAVDLNGVVDGVLHDLGPAIAAEGTVIERSTLPVVTGDRHRLVQLFTNIIGNSLKFRSSDRAEIVSISAEPGEEGSWVIRIRDNGIGMAEESLAEVFEIFRRLHGPSSPYPGAGLGLALAKRIVECHGGRIWAVSRPDQGCTIAFTIPKLAA